MAKCKPSVVQRIRVAGARAKGSIEGYAARPRAVRIRAVFFHQALRTILLFMDSIRQSEYG